jgi:predicted TIM-barrel fold metal-dependent hydrolase
MRIDVHAHYWAQPYIDALVAAGRKDLAFAGQRDDLDERLAEMDRAEVDVQIFSAIGLNTEVAEPDAAAATCRVINDLYVNLADTYERRFRGFASVPLPHLSQAISEADRALAFDDIVGIALPCIVGGEPIDTLTEFWDHLGARNEQVVVYVHPVGMDSNCHPGLDQFGLNMLLGSTTQTAMAALRVGLTGITRRHPNLQFIFALCGGTLPFLWNRYERNLRRGIEMSAVAAVGRTMFAWMDDIPFDAADPMALLRQNVHFDTSVQDIPAALQLTKETIGVDRMLLGSDAIFASLTEAVDAIVECRDLTADEKRRILDVNAQALLELD